MAVHHQAHGLVLLFVLNQVLGAPLQWESIQPVGLR